MSVFPSTSHMRTTLIHDRVVTPFLRSRFFWKIGERKQEPMVSFSTWRRCDTTLCCFKRFLRNFLLAKLDGSSPTHAQQTNLKNSSRNFPGNQFLHLCRRRNCTLNSRGNQAVPLTNCQSGNAVCTFSKNCNPTEEGLTTPNIQTSLHLNKLRGTNSGLENGVQVYRAAPRDSWS